MHLNSVKIKMKESAVIKHSQLVNTALFSIIVTI